VKGAIAVDFSTVINQIINCPIIAYHHFVETADGNMQFTNTAAKLEKDVRTLLENGYTPISLKQRYQCASGIEKWPEKPFVMTMDDGYESNYLLAYPLLKRLGVHIDMFIITDYMGERVGSSNSAIRHFSWEHALEMEQSGMVSMQAHGKKHLNNAELTMDELHENVFGCIDAIEANLGKREYIAYSHAGGNYREDKFDYLFKHGVHNQMMNFWCIEDFYVKRSVICRFVTGENENVLDCIKKCKSGLTARLTG
jgi:peptidoglycan/xylan/chitin deacetylase (PgdA/CDA1 family)